MSSEIEKYMFPFEKREQMRKHEIYKSLEEPWNNGLYSTSQKVGSLSYLIREAHQKIKAKGFDSLSRANWAKYYINTGKMRNSKKEEQSSSDYYKLNQYYGRTLDDLLVIAKEFYKDCKENYNIKISPVAALNVVYMKIVDDTYTSYQRDINTILNLKSKFKDYSFELTNGLDFDNYAVDIIVKKDDDIVGAIQVLPESAKKHENKQINIKTETEQKHELFEMVYGIKPQKLYSSSTGYIKGSLPEF